MERENRYLVLKRSDLEAALNDAEKLQLRELTARVIEHRMKRGKPSMTCVVVESDWPEYEPTWKAIEARVDGTPQLPLKELITQIADWKLPGTGKFWDNDLARPMSYGSCYGSNGSEKYIRGLAEQALSLLSTFNDETKLELSRLKRVQKEWEELWAPIDDVVRPLTPLGHHVSDKALELIKERLGVAVVPESTAFKQEHVGSNFDDFLKEEGIYEEVHTGAIDELKIEAGYAHVESVVGKADGESYGAPWWHGWAVREAFVAGAEWQEKLAVNDTSIGELPGMWHESDLSGGWADSQNKLNDPKLVAVPTPVTENDAADYLAYSNTTPKQAWALGWNQCVEQALSTPTPPSAEQVQIPTTVEQAELMQKLGLAWLKQHAPERLVEQPDSAASSNSDDYPKGFNDGYKAGGEGDVELLAHVLIHSTMDDYAPKKHQRITEQDALSILEARDENPVTVYDKWLPKLLTKLNEHREPDYKAQHANELLATLKEVRSEANIWLDEMKPSVLRRIDLAIAQCEGKGDYDQA